MAAAQPMWAQPTSSTRQLTFRQRWVRDWWLVELLGVLSSCVLTGLLCVLLYLFDRRQVPTFGSSLGGGISIGTIVALLITLSVATALVAVQECLSQLKWLWYWGQSRPMGDIDTYDRASRGTSGSLALLCKLRAFRSPVASLGALLMVSQLLVAPLAQQTLDIVIQSVPDTNSDASVAATTKYSQIDFSRTASIPIGYNRLSPAMKGAILNGLFTDITIGVNATLPSCGTGNCTFDPYQTLHVCSRAENITLNLTEIRDPKSLSADKLLSRFCIPGTGNCLSANDKLDIDESPSAAGMMFSAAGAPPAQFNITTDFRGDQNDDFVTVPLQYNSVSYSNHTSPLAAIYMIYLPDSVAVPNPIQPVHAVELLLDWCVLTFDTAVSNGQANSTSTSQTWMNFQATEEKNIGPPLFGGLEAVVDGQTYMVDERTHHSLQRHLQLLFNGTIWSGTSGEGVVPDGDVVQVMFDQVDLPVEDLERIGHKHSLEPMRVVLDHAATSMSNSVRQNFLGVPNGKNVVGTALVQQPTVRVVWPWVLAPVLFSLSSLVFFISVAIIGRRPTSSGDSGKPLLWKSSATAALRGLDADLQQSLGGMVSKASMEMDAQNTEVRLMWNGTGWMFSRSQTWPGMGDRKESYSSSQSAFKPYEISYPQTQHGVAGGLVAP